jgi:hypothetical protein
MNRSANERDVFMNSGDVVIGTVGGEIIPDQNQ